MSKSSVLIIGCLGLIVLFICGFFVLMAVVFILGGFTGARQVADPSRQQETPASQQSGQFDVPGAGQDDPSLQLPTDNPTQSSEEQVFVPEVILLEQITGKLQGSNWKSKDAPLPFSTSDLDQSLLTRAIEHELDKESRLKIPAQYEYLFLGSAAESEIRGLLSKAYDEYLEFLKNQNVKQAYLQEFRERVLPNNTQRIIYISGNNPSPAAYVEKYSGSGDDYGQLMARFYARHFYNEFNTVSKSGIYGNDLSDPKVARSYRDLGIRFIAYHEYTHALQRAHANLNLPAGESGRKSYVDSLLNNGKSLMNADDVRWRLKWGPSYLDDVNNQVVSEERQADSIAFEVLVGIYKFEGGVSARLKSRMFGRLSTARDSLNSSLPKLHTQNPEQDLGALGSLLVTKMQISYPAGSKERKALSDMLFRLDGLPAYVGYFNPMSQQELTKLWGLLRV